ncbi:hypothetical protein [Pseudoalteromonas denitrificans]|uniref:Uncharacterized protein n=1 Tax=Pseudoalteromonas denitrificans DSM 6059 TaxID=1123010 RepID=A0A1I1ERV2_9GAMM|nr:hypothetical protein [Pseudoalteromonas denitrificans]SFB89855.1 hypothetical protein SAMN02745724_00412 [Pseudoalteromonas denitrificans DSM 6059]
MKFISILSAVLLIFISTTSVNAQSHKLYSNQGYPYNLLIKRTDKIKIIYSESESSTKCRVEIKWKNSHISTQSININHSKFNQKPLASCLPRAQAKLILKKTFS